MKLGQIVEKGFFIDSTKSLPLQLTDVSALAIRKHEEVRRTLTLPKAIEAGAYELIAPLIHRGSEAFADVMGWLAEEEKKKRPGK